MSETIWIVRDPKGEVIGAAVDRTEIAPGFSVMLDGAFRALDQAFGRYSSMDAYRGLTRAAENSFGDRYEHHGYTLTREPLPPRADATTRGVVVAWAPMRDGEAVQSFPPCYDRPTDWAECEAAFKWKFVPLYAHPAPAVRVLDSAWWVFDKHNQNPAVNGQAESEGEAREYVAWHDVKFPNDGPHRYARVCIVEGESSILPAPGAAVVSTNAEKVDTSPERVQNAPENAHVAAVVEAADAVYRLTDDHGYSSDAYTVDISTPSPIELSDALTRMFSALAAVRARRQGEADHP